MSTTITVRTETEVRKGDGQNYHPTDTQRTQTEVRLETGESAETAVASFKALTAPAAPTVGDLITFLALPPSGFGN